MVYSIYSAYSSYSIYRVIEQFCPMLFVVNQTVFEHLRIAGEDILMVEGTQERGVDDDTMGVVEDPDLVLPDLRS